MRTFDDAMRKKIAIARRVISGEGLEAVAKAHGVTAARVSQVMREVVRLCAPAVFFRKSNPGVSYFRSHRDEIEQSLKQAERSLRLAPEQR